MTQEISSEGTVFALIADTSDIAEGVYPLTDPMFSLQVMSRKHMAGYIAPKHTHKEVLRSSVQVNEALVVMSGEITARIGDMEGKDIGTYTISVGQCLLMLKGTHEIIVTKDALLYEFKNGPFVDDKVLL